MNFFTVQSLNAYTRNMEMQMKWQKKQDTNDFTADGSMRLDNDPTRRQAEEIRKSREDGSDQLAKQIDLKLNSGQKLTAEEMDYLRKHDPQAYQKVKSIEAEQKNYENELKKCKTKEEVERVKMAHTATSLSAVNSIMNNPVIPEESGFADDGPGIRGKRRVCEAADRGGTPESREGFAGGKREGTGYRGTVREGRTGRWLCGEDGSGRPRYICREDGSGG